MFVCMVKGEFNFDINDACFNDGYIYNNAYSISNEPLNNILRLLPVSNKRVLTVAASGDQPILYAAHGAAHVDTFDVTYTARILMDFKTAAIQTMTRAQYCEQICDIENLYGKDRNEIFLRAMEKMPADTRDMINLFMSKGRFDAFYRPDMGDNKNIVDVCKNWREMQKNVPGSFNFIWSNLINLHKYIDGEYDIINVSNIFEYYTSNMDILKTFQNLWPHLRTNGHIVCSTFCVPNYVTGLQCKQWLNQRAQIVCFNKFRNCSCGAMLIQKQH